LNPLYRNVIACNVFVAGISVVLTKSQKSASTSLGLPIDSLTFAAGSDLAGHDSG